MNNCKKYFLKATLYWYVLFFSLTITFIVSYLFFVETKKQALRDFQSEINLIERSFDSNLIIYEQILKGVKGLFNSVNVNNNDWNNYMDALDFKQRFSALKWIGFALAGNYSNNMYTKYIYPHSRENNNLLNYNLASNKTILDAISKSKVLKRSVISNRIKLNENEQVSLMIMPVYNYSNENEPVGYIYTPFATTYSLNKILNSFKQSIGMTIYEGREINNEKILYRNYAISAESDIRLSNCINNYFNFYAVRHYTSYGKDYTLTYSSLTSENMDIYGFRLCLIFLIGVSFSLLLFFVVRTLVITNIKAMELAKEMTKEINKNKEELEELAHYDSLTGIINRYFFKKTLNHAIALAERYNYQIALFFIDLDEFKKINDNLGHDTGDFVLKEVANRVKNCLREVDTIGRLGGDEFVVIIEKDINKDNLAKIAQSIINKINEPIIVNDNNISIGCSIGISIYPNNAQSIEKLMKEADIAMYTIKNQGKNQYLISEKIV